MFQEKLKENKKEWVKKTQQKISPNKNTTKEKEKEQMKKTQQNEGLRLNTTKLTHMCTPGAFLSVIQGFNEVQKDCVKQMGFREILKMKMTEVPGALRVIDVTKESVKEILGFPLGRKQLSKLPFRTKEDKCYKEWTNQFEEKKMIRLQDIKMKIFSTNKADMNFWMNFIALLIKSLIKSNSLRKANTNPLNYITSKTKIRNIDWCSYLIDYLIKNKPSFDPSNPTSNFNGPCAYLVLLYLDIIKSDVLKVERTRPVICHWISEKINMRETFEKDEVVDFGTGDFIDEFVEEESNENAYEEKAMIKYRNFGAIFDDENEDYQEKNGNDDVQDENNDDEEDGNGDDNNEEKKKNVGRKNIEGGIGEENENRNNKEKIKMRDVKILKEQVSGEEDETDNNDQGLDDMNLHDEAIENDKGGDIEEEQNVEGGGVEGKNIEGNNAKKGERRTNEEPRRVGEGVEGKNLERMNADKGKGIIGEEQNSV
uniref:Uncharacterized protein n=1 Tax=Lactuca sativa TaxID=4236 RepID=A0A9R1V4N5_LACSA|nr:hypothetical protein LSAT_V11C700344380 [Lactuca sativa]